MNALLRKFRNEAEGIEPGAGRKFPASLQLLGGEYARGCRDEGATWGDIASELGVTVATVQRWGKTESMGRGEFHEVRVEDTPKVGYAAVLPCGLRIEGLGLEAVIALAKALC